MKTISYHIKGISISLMEFAKGNFLIFFIPGIVLTAIYYVLHYYTDSLEESYKLTSDYSWINWIYDWYNAGVTKAFSLLDVVMEQIYIFSVITLLSPFNTLLAKKLDSKLTGNEYKTDFIRFLNEIFRMIFIVMIALLLQLGCYLTYWLISFAFGLDVIDSVVYFLISAFFFGFAFYDYALERHNKRIIETISFTFSNPLMMLMTGTLFLLLYKIPIAGVPFSPVITVMVSTIVYLYHTKKLPLTKPILNTENNE